MIDEYAMEQIIVVALILALAFWKRHVFLYLMAAPAAITFGLAWAESYLVPGIIIAVIGGYCLYLAGMQIFGR